MRKVKAVSVSKQVDSQKIIQDFLYQVSEALDNGKVKVRRLSGSVGHHALRFRRHKILIKNNFSLVSIDGADLGQGVKLGVFLDSAHDAWVSQLDDIQVRKLVRIQQRETEALNTKYGKLAKSLLSRKKK
jgi:hypothetical protein